MVFTVPTVHAVLFKLPICVLDFFEAVRRSHCLERNLDESHNVGRDTVDDKDPA